MPGYMYVPRENRFQNQMFSLLSNALMQNMAYKQEKELRASRQEFETESENRRIQLQLETSGYTPMSQEESNWQQTGQVKPDVTVGGKGYKKPAQRAGIVNIKGRDFLQEQRNGQMYLKPLPQAKSEDTAAMKQYNLAKSEGYTGTFYEYQKSLRRAGATRIGLGEKVAQTRAVETAKDEVSARAYLKSPKFIEDRVSAAKQKIGEMWDVKEDWEKEEAIFDEVSRVINEAFPNETITYGVRNGKRGFYNTKGELKRLYDGQVGGMPAPASPPNWQRGVIRKKIR